MAIQIDLFFAPHCSACRRFRPRLKQWAAAHKNTLVVRELNVLEHLDEAVSAGVLRTPTVVVDGRVRLSGQFTDGAFEALVRELRIEKRT